MKSESSLIDFFDKSYIINLPERADRRKGMNQELKKLGGSELSDRVNFFPAIKPTDKGEFPSIGARGCFLSHLEVLKKAQSQNLNNLLIMEDDLGFTRLLIERQDAIVRDLQRLDWDFAYFGHIVSLPPSEELWFREDSQPIRLTHFLAVNKTTIPKLVDFLEEVLRRPAGHPDGGPMHVDGAYSTFRQQNSEIITLMANPSLGFQRSSPSDIAGYKWFDRVPILNQLGTAVRGLKNWYKQR